MSVSSIGPSNATAQMLAATQSKVADVPNDGDADDHAAPVQAAPAPGTGQDVDKTA